MVDYTVTLTSEQEECLTSCGVADIASYVRGVAAIAVQRCEATAKERTMGILAQAIASRPASDPAVRAAIETLTAGMAVSTQE